MQDVGIQVMLSDPAVVSRALSPVSAAGSCARADFFFSDRHTPDGTELTVVAGNAAASSMRSAPEREQEPFDRLLRDERESVNRLYGVVSQIGCDVLFYSATGRLIGRYGKPQRNGYRLPGLAQGPASPLASAIFDPNGSFVGSLDVLPAGGEWSETVAAVIQILLRMTAHAVAERAFRKRYAREWIVAAAPPDEAAGSILLAVDRHRRVIGADRRARMSMLRGASDSPAVPLWSLFEMHPAIFQFPDRGDVPVVLTMLGSGEPWSALITPPALDPCRAAANPVAHTRPRPDLLGWTDAPPTRATSRGGLTPRALRRVSDHIDAHITENVSLRALADVAGLSRSHFARVFKQSLRISPHAYLIQRRLERAQRLLAETDYSLFQVALDSGFTDQSHFSSCFRRHFGVNPSSFRRSQR